MAETFQRSLLAPSIPILHSWQLTAHYQSASRISTAMASSNTDDGVTIVTLRRL